MRKTMFVAHLLLISASTATYADVASLCESKERTVWSCQVGTKIYSVCASQDLSGTTGYLQYRAGTAQKTDFRFPTVLLHPKDHFEFGLLAHGARLSFSNGGYSYSIAEDLKGGTIIDVEKSNRSVSTIHCRDSTATLTETSTIDLFTSAGIAK